MFSVIELIDKRFQASRLLPKRETSRTLYDYSPPRDACFFKYIPWWHVQGIAPPFPYLTLPCVPRLRAHMSSCDITMGYLIASTVLPAISCFLSIVRLSIRWRKGQLGWDDAWVLLAIISTMSLTAGAFLNCEDTTPSMPDGRTNMRVLGYYMSIVGFTCTLWAVRMSLLASVLRIIPVMLYRRKWTKGSGVIFILFWISLVAQKVIICETEPTWKQGAAVQCPLNRANALYELFADCVADLILTILPLRIVWRLRTMIRPHLLFLTLIFSSTLLITIACIIYEVFVYCSMQEQWTNVMMQITASTALTVCQLGVLVKWIVRLCGPRKNENPDDNSIKTVLEISMVFAKTSVLQDVEAVHHVHLSVVKEESVVGTFNPATTKAEPGPQPVTGITDAS
ncbi:hypothetical protein QCA50_001986 [Cerrena zonata]|uniref:Rhodopsin domain-containing protein n=1 Tax=Cerrena zonata TaxID=2478898 RepID=A0AAW0GMI9_9APHY